MLISEMVITRKGFLRPTKTPGYPDSFHTPPSYLKELHQDILSSPKFVVPDYMLNIADIDCFSKIMDTWSDERMKDHKNISNKIDLYYKYSRLPFDSIVLECSQYLLLLKRCKITLKGNIEHGYTSTLVSNLGYVSSVRGLTLYEVVKEPRVLPQLTLLVLNTSFQIYPVDQLEQGLKGQYNVYTMMLEFSAAVMEILLHLCVSNRRVVEFESEQNVKKRDSVSGRINKLAEKILYKVLILDNTKPRFINTSDISAYITHSGVEGVKMRAAIVRGHFKQRKTGLFWWGDFVRNYQNAITVGIVDKTYEIRN